jgi:CHAD domain-containing protein
VLGARVDALIKTTVGAQDQLGLLHDADVTAGMLRSFVAENAALDAGDLAAVAAYLADVQLELQVHRDRFAEVWRHVVDKPFRLQLARLLGAV